MIRDRFVNNLVCVYVLLLSVGCKQDDNGAPLPPPPLAYQPADLGQSRFVLPKIERGDAAAPAPLRDWMNARFGGPWPAQRITQYAPALRALAGAAPKTMPNWTSIARDGAHAAELGDEHAVRAACRACHDAYQQTYVSTLRAEPLRSGL